jgi:hypothetical protein
LVVSFGGGWWWDHSISDFVAVATSSIMSIGGGWWLEHCISDFVAHVLATSSLVPLGGFSGSSQRYVAGRQGLAC